MRFDCEYDADSPLTSGSRLTFKDYGGSRMFYSGLTFGLPSPRIATVERGKDAKRMLVDGFGGIDADARAQVRAVARCEIGVELSDEDVSRLAASGKPLCPPPD